MKLQVSTCLLRWSTMRNRMEVLLARRSPNHRSFQGLWEFGGGTVEDGETLVQAASREAREEFAVEVDTWSPICTTYFIRKGADVTHGVRQYGLIQDQAWIPTLSWEHDEWGFEAPHQMDCLPLIPGLLEDLRYVWPWLLKEWGP